MGNNPFAGFTGNTTWYFSTTDTTGDPIINTPYYT